MGSKNNLKLRSEKMAQRKTKYKIKKLNVGVASVMVGALLAFSNADAVNADVVDTTTNDEKTTQLTESTENKTEVALTETPEENTATPAQTDEQADTDKATEQVTAPVENNEVSPAESTAEAPQEQTRAAFRSAVADTPTVNAGQVIENNTQSQAVTLDHGDNETRSISVMVPAVAGDKVTVTVPYIFTASTDRSSNGELYNVDTETSPVADPGYVTNKSSQNTTFTYNINTTASMTFNLKLMPTVSDWSFLTPGSKFQVVVKKNGDEIGEITYTIGQPAEITAVNLNFDQNQTAENGLVKDQKYVLGINLANNGQKDGDNFAGTVTLNVPKGFLADTTSIGYAYGLTDKTVVGDTADNFATLANGKNVTIKQAGAGEPVVIEFNNAKTDLLKGSLLLFGTYTTELAASDNKFDATVAYYSINNEGERAKDMIQQAVGTKQLNLAVADKVNNSWEAQFKKKDGEIYTDNGQADGVHQSDDTKLDYNDNGNLIRSIEVYNNGNIAQENVLIHLDIEPGTIMNGGEGEYALAITSSSENQPSGLTRATLTDGRTVDLQMGNFVTSNVNSIVVAIDDKAISAGVAKDGSNIKALDIGYKNIEAGTKVKINFSNNAILEKGTTKKINDTAEYSYTVTSDKGQELTGKMSLKIKAPSPSKNQFTGNILNFDNTSYQPTSENGGNIAKITYQIRNIVQYDDIPSSYFIAIPQGFDLADASQLHVYKRGGALYEDAVVEDLGYIGINGERMFKISLPETPWYRTPVLINGTSYTTPLELVADKNQLPLSYAYPENGMSLFMELNENDQVSAPTNGFANISEVTLRDGKTYKVRATNLGFYKEPNEVKYSFTYPSTYGPMNGIKAADAGKYTEETGTTKLAYSSSKELANSKGTIRLANVLTDKGVSEYSYNVINLPSVENGDNATIVLTGEGVDKVTTTGTGNGQLLFAYTPFVGDQVTEAALVDFVTADQVTDWSKVRAVVLKSDKLDPSATAMAELGFKVTGIKDGSSVVGVTLQDHFTGEHENSTGVSGVYNVAPTYKLEIQRYVDVTTRWIDTDGNEIQAPDVQNIMSGDPYVTTGITRPHYKFVRVEGQPAGVTAGQDIVVTYVYEADKEIEAQSVKFEQTINYVYAENDQVAAPTVTKVITFTRDKVNNLALNKVTYTPWMVDGKEVTEASFAAVTSPEIKGYTADQKEVAAITVMPTDEKKAYVTTVKYTKNPTENVTEDKTVTRTINYIYSDGTQAVVPNVATKTFTRTGIKDTVTGEITWNAWSEAQEFGAVTSPVLKGYTADKAEVAAQSVTADSADVEVTVTYTKQAATEVSETKEVTRTIKYVYADGTQAADPVVETKTFTRSGAKDAATDEITWNAWSEAQEFGAVTSPVLKGYTADKAEVAAQSVTADSADVEVTVTYTKQAAAEVSETKEVTRTIKYVYADGTQAADPVVETKTFTRSGAKDAATDEITWNAWSEAQEFGAVTSPVLKGYTADKAEVAAQSVTADSANIEVTVTYTKQSAAEVSETKEVTRTIKYVYADGTQAADPVVETKTFTRTGAKDAATDEITWNAWSEAQEFGAVASPVLKGYTADKAEVAAQSVTADSANIEVTVTYTKQTAAEVSETKEVTRTINYVYADGTQAAAPVVETKTFTRTGAKDAVTDEITWNAWSEAQEFGAVTSPVLKGYTADKAEVAAQSVTADSANIEVTVTYAKQAAAEVSETKEVTRTINYVYADGTQVAAPVVETKTFTRTGAKDAATDKIAWNAWSEAQEFGAVTSPVLKGYTADKAEVAAQSVTADSADVEVTVTYTKQAAAEVSETKEVTRTINYVYADGLQALAPVVETKIFTRTGAKDAVTDEITWGAWSGTQEFTSVTSPQISGYWADRASIPAITVDHMSPDQVERVVYTANYSLTERFVDNAGNELAPSVVKKNLFVPGMSFDNTADAKVITGYVLQKIENGVGTFGKGDETTTFIYAKVGNIVSVDENGNALVPPVPYENDKDDPSGVTPHQKVPTIPGYKAEVEFVDPTDPTSDTIVKYVAEKPAEEPVVPEVPEKQEPAKKENVTVPTSQVGEKVTTPVTNETKVAELPQMGDDAKAQATSVGAMLVALAGILGLGVKNKRKED